MDPLALLSNLHGDGPATLSRLRRNGYDTLGGLLDVSSEELASVLGWEAVRTERFMREAEVLARRLGESMLEEEEMEAVPRRARLDADESDDADGADEIEEVMELVGLQDLEELDKLDEDLAQRQEKAFDEQEYTHEPDPEVEVEVEQESSPDAEAVPEGVRDKVLVRWRELDEETPDSASRDEQEPAEPAVEEEVLVPQAPVEQAASGPARGTPLGEVKIDGLDTAHYKALVAAGVVTVEALAEADSLALHHQSGLPFTLIDRLSFLARRAAIKEPVDVPVHDGEGLDAAGPFA